MNIKYQIRLIRLYMLKVKSILITKRRFSLRKPRRHIPLMFLNMKYPVIVANIVN